MPNPIKDFAGALDAIDAARGSVVTAERALRAARSSFDDAKANAGNLYFEAHRAASSIGYEMPDVFVYGDHRISFDEEGAVTVDRHDAIDLADLLRMSDEFDRTHVAVEVDAESMPCNS
ncbi:hypothetical protein HMPREF3289_01230 [Pseudomonas sp. HMSC75E02]|uniref:hypothetical protein n=1 Tax=Pseudomonas sp. HMSC75E02 TaxID=1608908 RepID=UPI0008A9C750|nr:hypothetical protein [Pseudomonas sp. HMSC75E02]OHS09318.1 hypothetical protein HMPREF3289_01230 [Pseudomonas sp. HMSC75E02]